MPTSIAALGASHFASHTSFLPLQSTSHEHHRSARDAEDHIHDVIHKIDTMSEKVSSYEDTIYKYAEALQGDGQSFRQSSLDDINWGVTILANGLKFISAVLTVLGDDNVDRNDNIGEAYNSFFTFGGTMLRFASEYLLSTNQTPAVDKLGVAASTFTTNTLTPQQLLQQNQIKEYIGTLSLAEIQQKQQAVLQHVQQETFNKKLTEAQAQLLLATTLEHNGLPQIGGSVGSDPTAAIGGLFSGVGNALTSVLGGGAGAPSTENNQLQATPGLPAPGTLQHSIMLGLFKANQGLNQFVKGLTGGNSVAPSQPAADNKIGQAAGATTSSDQQSDGGLLGTVSLLPNTLKTAATQVATFFAAPPTKQEGSSTEGITYSEVNSGLNPTFAATAALGVLTTGAVGSVLYSYAANSRSDLATSATSLAQGALDALKKNDIVEAAGNALESITGNKLDFLSDDDVGNIAYDMYDYYQDYYNSQQQQGYDPRVENYENTKEYPDYEYQDPREQIVQSPIQQQKNYQAYPENQAYSNNQAYTDNQAYQENQAYSDNQAYQGNQAFRDNQAYQDNDAYADKPLISVNPPDYPPQQTIRSDTVPTYSASDFENYLDTSRLPYSSDNYVQYSQDTQDWEAGTNQERRSQEEVGQPDRSTFKEPKVVSMTDSLPSGIPENVEFWDPDKTKKPVDPKVPFVTYNDKNNPFYYLESGAPTDHLYRKF